MASNVQDPNALLDHGRYKGTPLKDVPDSYVKWMIAYSEGELQFWQAEQMRRRFAQTGKDGAPVIVEMAKVVTKVMEENPAFGADADVRKFVDWARQAAATVAAKDEVAR